MTSHRLSIRSALAALCWCVAATTGQSACSPNSDISWAHDRHAQATTATSASSASAVLVKLPQDKGDLSLSPACLDGSAYGFYFRPSATGSSRWTLNFEGGGWCYDEETCYCRATTSRHGSSRWLPPTMANFSSPCECMNPRSVNGSLDSDCNCIYLPYCDGASFSGHRAKPWPVPPVPNGAAHSRNVTVTFRGLSNLDGAVAYAMERGMESASELVIAGNSAGGLAALLHTDRVAALVRAASPAVVVRSAPGGGTLGGAGGYFLDHGSYTDKPRGTPNTPQWDANATFTAKMKYLYEMQNLTFGPSGGLMAPCQAAHSTEPWLCFLAPHAQAFVTTPMFLFNSKYDAWQLGNILQTGGLTNSTSAWNSEPVQRAVVQYGKDFLTALEPFWKMGGNPPRSGRRQPQPQPPTRSKVVRSSKTRGDGGTAADGGFAASSQPAPAGASTSSLNDVDAQEGRNGGFITSCVCHECRWDDPNLMLGGKPAVQHYAEWFSGKTLGPTAMHIDGRLPNGGGTFSKDMMCRSNGTPSDLQPCCLPFGLHIAE